MMHRAATSRPKEETKQEIKPKEKKRGGGLFGCFGGGGRKKTKQPKSSRR